MRLKLSRLCFSLLEYLTGLTLYSLYLIFSLSLFFRRWSWWGWIRSRLDRRSSHPCVRHYCCPGHCLQRLHEREAVSRFVSLSLSLFYSFTCLLLPSLSWLVSSRASLISSSWYLSLLFSCLLVLTLFFSRFISCCPVRLNDKSLVSWLSSYFCKPFFFFPSFFLFFSHYVLLSYKHVENERERPSKVSSSGRREKSEQESKAREHEKGKHEKEEPREGKG